ncbi:MAG: MAB_1171c family putative transporter [Kibdelosporangium sp.]
MLLWGLVAGWLPAVRRGAKQRALWLIFLSLALAKTVTLEPVADGINSGIGTNANTLAQHLLGILAAVALLRFISLISGAYVERPRAKAVQLFLGLGVAAALILLFAISSDGIQSSADELIAAPIVRPTTVVYWLLMEAYLGTALYMGAMLIWRVSKSSPTNALRISLWIMVAGVALNVLFAIYKSAYILLHVAGADLPKIVATISNYMLSTSNLLTVIGVSLPALTAARSLLRARRSLHALAPLWQTMRATFPDMILYVSAKLPTADGILATARLRLYRRLIEIRDGMLELRGYIPAAVHSDALGYLAEKGIEGDEAAVLAEACWIEVALRRVRAGDKPGGNPPAGSSIEGGENEEEEARWLSRVSQAHAKSPHPKEFADRWETTATPALSPS